MIEFEHIISKAEVDTHYINLTDECGERYGGQIGKHGTLFTVVDEKGKEHEMRRHHGNQLTGCTAWFTEHAITPGTHVTIRFDQQLGKIHLLCGVKAQPSSSSEIASFAFVHEGRYIQVRCTADGGLVRVSGSVDGKKVGTFDFASPLQSAKRRRIREYE